MRKSHRSGKNLLRAVSICDLLKKKTHDRRRGGKLVSVPLRHFADERESRGHTVASDSCNSRVLLTISVYLLLNLPYCGLCTKLVFLERFQMSVWRSC